MKKAFWVLGLVMAMAWQACTTISEAEQAGLNAVQQHYGGTVGFGKGKTNGEHLFTVKLDHMPEPYDLNNNFDVAGHHIAVLMYQHFTRTEREAYDGIRLEVDSPEGVQSLNFYFSQVRFVYRSFIEARREVGYIYNKKYSKFVEKFQPGVQENFPADSLALVMDTLYKQTGKLQEPVFIGVDTFHFKENTYGEFLFVAHADNEERSPEVLYSLVYKINSNRGPFGYAVYRWSEKSTFLAHKWDNFVVRVRARLD